MSENVKKIKIVYEDGRGNEMAETVSVGETEIFDEGLSPWKRTVKEIIVEDD